MERWGHRYIALTLIASLSGAGCAIGAIEGGSSSKTSTKDSGTPVEDTGEPPPDDTGSPEDTGAPPDDTGEPPPDDTGSPPDDTGSPPPDDTGTPPPTDTGPPPTGDYPPGPYSKTVGGVLPNLSWMGYRDGTGAWTTIKMSDFYDPTGAKGV